MNTFWFGFFNQFRDCGRSAAWFLVTLGGSFVGLLVVAWALDNGHAAAVEAGAGVVVFLVICFLSAAIRRSICNRRNRLKFGGLSEDELNKARARLVRRGKPAGTLPTPSVKPRVQPGQIF